MSKKTKTADDFADRMLATYTKQTEALERQASSLDRIASLLAGVAAMLAAITDQTKPMRMRQKREKMGGSETTTRCALRRGSPRDGTEVLGE